MICSVTLQRCCDKPRKLHFGLGEPDFNMVIRSAALERKGYAIYRSELFFRWYCLIVPRLGGAMGGFEFPRASNHTPRCRRTTPHTCERTRCRKVEQMKLETCFTSHIAYPT